MLAICQFELFRNKLHMPTGGYKFYVQTFTSLKALFPVEDSDEGSILDLRNALVISFHLFP